MHPLVVKHVLLPLHEKIIGRDTLHYLDELERTQWWPADQLRDLQQTKLRALLRHAHAKSPYHRRRLDAAGVSPDSVTLADLPRLPTLTKADIAEHSRDIIDPSVPGGLHRLTTGGSTGSPLAFCVDRSRQAADQAARARTRRWFGIDLGQRELYLWGSPVEQAAQDRLKRLRDAVTNHRLLNAFKMTPAQMSRYLDEIRRFDPVHIFGYPSSIARLVRHAVAAGRSIRNHSLKAVFTTGELFLPSDRAVIEEHAGVPVADGYGSREAGFIAQQCPSGSYHVTMESLIVELIDTDGRPVANGRPGEIAITHLDAFGMPFIRYRTGDVARRSPGACPCGRGLECLDIIEGRRTDMLRTTAGGFAHALSVIYVLRDEPAVREFKIIQRPSLDLDVYVVPRHGEGSIREGEAPVEPYVGAAGARTDTAGARIPSRTPTAQSGESEPSGECGTGLPSGLPAGATTAGASLPSRTAAPSSSSFILHPSSFSASSAHRIITLLKRQIGDTIDVRLHLVESIEADPSGKHRYVVSEA